MSSPSLTSKHPSQTKSISLAKPSNLPFLIQLPLKHPSLSMEMKTLIEMETVIEIEILMKIRLLQSLLIMMALLEIS